MGAQTSGSGCEYRMSNQEHPLVHTGANAPRAKPQLVFDRGDCAKGISREQVDIQLATQNPQPFSHAIDTVSVMRQRAIEIQYQVR
jgi:hypothetical protein